MASIVQDFDIGTLIVAAQCKLGRGVFRLLLRNTETSRCLNFLGISMSRSLDLLFS